MPGMLSTFNGYSYAEGNPSNFTDPSGRCAEPLTFTLCAIAGGAIIAGVTGTAHNSIAQNHNSAR